MSISIRERPYGGVFRIHPDGQVSAHVERIREAVDEHGNVQPGMAMELPPIEVDAAGPEFAELLAAVNTAAVASNARLQAELLAVQDELAALKADSSETIRIVQMAADAATAARAKAEDKAAIMEAEVAALRAKLNALEPS